MKNELPKNLASTKSGARLRVGDRFIRTDARPYHDGPRGDGIHTTTLLCEVTSTDASGFRYRAVEMLAESGRPSFAGKETGGAFAWFGWDYQLAEGRVRRV